MPDRLPLRELLIELGWIAAFAAMATWSWNTDRMMAWPFIGLGVVWLLALVVRLRRRRWLGRATDRGLEQPSWIGAAVREPREPGTRRP